MMKPLAMVALAAALCAVSANAAQLYRWVDENGRVEWRDTPPPANAKNVEQRTVGGNTIETSGLPYSVQQAVKNFPVTLWVFDCGDPCNRARSHLARRGIPHTERNAQKEGETLVKLMGGTEVPVLIVGSTRLKGYLESEWDATLDNAGYPKSPPPGAKAKAPAAAPKPSAKDGGVLPRAPITPATPAPAAAR